MLFLCFKISTLEILNHEDQGELLSDDEIFSSRQTAKHTCMALRRYFEAHLAIKVEHVKQSLQRTEGGAPVHSQPYYKVNRGGGVCVCVCVICTLFHVDAYFKAIWIQLKSLISKFMLGFLSKLLF